jgi:hypothetical protein
MQNIKQRQIPGLKTQTYIILRLIMNADDIYSALQRQKPGDREDKKSCQIF